MTILVIFLPGGIEYSEKTNWKPVYSKEFSIILIIFYTIFYFLPLMITTKRVHDSFNDTLLKKKIKYFSIGIVILAFSFYGLLFYITTDNPFYKIIWSVLSFIIIPSGLFIYYGTGREL